MCGLLSLLLIRSAFMIRDQSRQSENLGSKGDEEEDRAKGKREVITT